jgi:hypothetical protein
MAQAFPNLTGKQIVNILLQTGDDLGATGVDAVYGHGRLNIQRAFQPVGTSSLAGSSEPITASDLPPAAGAPATGKSLGAIIIDGYDRAFVMDLAKTLQHAAIDRPLARSLQNDVRVNSAQAGPLNIAMTVRERHDLAAGFSLERVGIGPQDLRKSRLVAGSAVARIDGKTAIAFGFAEGAKAMERRLTGAGVGAFLIARDIAGDPGFSARRTGSLAVRHQMGRFGLTFAGESGNVWREVKTSANGSPYRFAGIAADRSFGRSWLSVGISRLEEKETFLGGRLSPILGGGGAATMFVDAEARHNFGNGWTGTLTARRAWTQFSTGKVASGAYAFDLAKRGILSRNDNLGLRIAQPLRIDRGGFSLMLPTGYDYGTTSATSSLSRMSLAPNGREIDAELSYGSSLLGGKAWIGGNLFYRRQPGHIVSLADDKGAAIRFSLGF